MARRAAPSEPSFGSDSFLDVTANLVGVLIILIVLVGLRVSKAPPSHAAVDAAIERRLADLDSGLEKMERQRASMERALLEKGRELAAKQQALAEQETDRARANQARQGMAQKVQAESDRVRLSAEELAQLQARLVSLEDELDQSSAVVPAAQELVHRSPLSQPVESDELHFEVAQGRVSFVDVTGLLEKAKVRGRMMEGELRSRGRATAEVGPVGGFRLRFTLAREDFPFSQSLLYGRGSFQARMVEWQVSATQDERGEPVEQAIQPGSQLNAVLARHSPNKYAVTLWTYADSFAAFRQLRDYFSGQGFVVAARPMPIGIPIRGSIYGSHSQAQ